MFFDPELHPGEDLEAIAKAELTALRAAQAGFSDAAERGDRFLYGMNYVERSEDYVASHFGTPMANALFATDVQGGLWAGPFASAHGLHLVYVSSRRDGRLPELSEVRERVLLDARKAKAREQADATIAEIVETYNISLDRTALQERALAVSAHPPEAE